MQFADDQKAADEEECPDADLADVDRAEVRAVRQEDECDGDGAQTVEPSNVFDCAHSESQAM
ncbi:hypothetical protein BIM11_5701 [Burkholderia pseudomallei]|nr:hypothetical protein BIM11_5701 [Burkholderia pseudomallei]